MKPTHTTWIGGGLAVLIPFGAAFAAEPPDIPIAQAAAINLFRLKAAENPGKAVERFGGEAFKRTWAASTGELLNQDGDRAMLRDFFASAVILVGPKRDLPVTALYNPWLDGALVATCDLQADRVVFPDFTWLSGETLRGDPIVSGKELMRLYLGGEPLEVLLADLYARSVAAFKAEYRADTGLIPDAWKVRAGDPREELALIATRMIQRQGMFRMFAEKPGREAAALSALTLKGLALDDPAPALDAILSDRQSAEMKTQIARFPVEIRRGFKPNFFVRSEDRHLVAFTNPGYPRWAATLAWSKRDGKRDIRMRLLDLEHSPKIRNL